MVDPLSFAEEEELVHSVLDLEFDDYPDEFHDYYHYLLLGRLPMFVFVQPLLMQPLLHHVYQ